MKASELLETVKSGRLSRAMCVMGKFRADELLKFVFKLGKLAPRMGNANVGAITCVECQEADPDIKITPPRTGCQVCPW